MLRALLIDFGGGNVSSAYNALLKTAPPEMQVTVSGSVKDVAAADYLVLPGQGAFADCMMRLEKIPQMIATLNRRVCEQAVPYLGICVGMQIMTARSEEHGNCQGLGWLDGVITRLKAREAGMRIKIPQMGWNDLHLRKSHAVTDFLRDGTDMYFVHSYGLLQQNDDVIASCDYGGEVAAIIGRDNMLGVQFHAEKSHHAGLRLIGNFLRWRP